MTRIAVDLEMLEEMVTRMVAFEQRFESVRDDVDVRMRRIGAVWTGVAAAQHADAHARWVAGAREMQEALTLLHSIAVTARENYTSAVRANLRMWWQ